VLLGTGLMGVVVLLVAVAGLRARPPVSTPPPQAGAAAPTWPMPPLAGPRPAADRPGTTATPDSPPPRRSPRAAATGRTTTGLVLRSPYRGPIARVKREPAAAAATAAAKSGAARPAPDASGSSTAAGRPAASAATAADRPDPPGRAALLGGPITLEELQP
jgi:hypothetical protein